MQQEGRKDYHEASMSGRAAPGSGAARRRVSSSSSSSRRASDRPASKIQIVCRSVRRRVGHARSSVGRSRGRSFRRLSFKQMNHLLRCHFLEFLGGAGQVVKTKPVYQRGME